MRVRVQAGQHVVGWFVDIGGQIFLQPAAQSQAEPERRRQAGQNLHSLRRHWEAEWSHVEHEAERGLRPALRRNRDFFEYLAQSRPAEFVLEEDTAPLPPGLPTPVALESLYQAAAAPRESP